jgi:hypothetical protein
MQDNSSVHPSITQSEAIDKIHQLVNSMLSSGLLDSVELSVRKHLVTEITIGQNSETYLIPFANELSANEIARALQGNLGDYVSWGESPRFFGVKYTVALPPIKKKNSLWNAIFNKK